MGCAAVEAGSTAIGPNGDTRRRRGCAGSGAYLREISDDTDLGTHSPVAALIGRAKIIKTTSCQFAVNGNFCKTRLKFL